MADLKTKVMETLAAHGAPSTMVSAVEDVFASAPKPKAARKVKRKARAAPQKRRSPVRRGK
jgi:hypothetical protein